MGTDYVNVVERERDGRTPIGWALASIMTVKAFVMDSNPVKATNPLSKPQGSRQAEGDKQTGQLGVSIDKAFELELCHARDEIRTRIGFHRQLLGFQLAALGASSGILGVALGQHLGPNLLEGFAVVLIWIAYAVDKEIRLNEAHVSALALFVEEVINTKYHIKGSESPVTEWGLFWERKHPLSWRIKAHELSVSNPSEVLNLILVAIALSLYSVQAYHQARDMNWHTFQPHWLTPIVLGCLLLIGTLLNVPVMMRSLSDIAKELRFWKRMHPQR